ncbi:MAG: hypothetical protein AAFZ89_12055 [Bacteroidota bacterium]
MKEMEIIGEVSVINSGTGLVNVINSVVWYSPDFCKDCLGTETQHL